MYGTCSKLLSLSVSPQPLQSVVPSSPATALLQKSSALQCVLHVWGVSG